MDNHEEEKHPAVAPPALTDVLCDDLLPCPFCGSRPRREVKNDMLIIKCPSCVSVGFHNHVRFGCMADEEWNTRVSNAGVNSASGAAAKSGD